MTIAEQIQEFFTNLIATIEDEIETLDTGDVADDLSIAELHCPCHDPECGEYVEVSIMDRDTALGMLCAAQAAAKFYAEHPDTPEGECGIAFCNRVTSKLVGIIEDARPATEDDYI